MASCNAWSIWGHNRLPIATGIGSRGNSGNGLSSEGHSSQMEKSIEFEASFEVNINFSCESFGMRIYQLNQNSENET